MVLLKATAMEEARRKLEKQYHAAREHLFCTGADTVENITRLDKQMYTATEELHRRYDMDEYGQNMLANLGLANLGLANNQTASGINAMMQGQQQPVNSNLVMGLAGTGLANSSFTLKPARAEEGVRMFRGAALPEKWMGAHYGGFARTAINGQWKCTFTSDYGSDSITLFLDTDKYSGFDADKVAQTYLETINQRRLG